MQVAINMLVEGERELDQFQVTVVRKKDGWLLTSPPLHVVATNYRLILWPETLESYPPASIPCTFIIEAREVEIDEQRALLLSLKTGHLIYLLVSSGRDRALMRDIQLMVRPPRSSRLYRPALARQEIARLVAFLESQ